MSKSRSKRIKKVVLKHKKKKMPIAPTANAKIIIDFMLENKIKGKSKDYVIIAGNRLIDWCGSYDIIKINEDGSVQPAVLNNIILVHKRKLCNIIDKDMASKFWKCGRRTNYGVESRRGNCATK